MLSPANHSARKPATTTNARHNGLKLVWSRDWQQAPEAAQRAVRRPAAKRRQRMREVREVVTLTLATAGLMAPLVWLAHSFLRHMKVL